MAIGDFFNSDKFAVSASFGVNPVTILQRSGERFCSSEDVDEIPRLCSEDFVIVGTFFDGMFFAEDIVMFDGEDFRERPWHERYLALKKNFDWTFDFRFSKHIVVKDRSEFEVASEIFRLLPHADGVILKPYGDDEDNDNKTYRITGDYLGWQDQ